MDDLTSMAVTGAVLLALAAYPIANFIHDWVVWRGERKEKHRRQTVTGGGLLGDTSMYSCAEDLHRERERREAEVRRRIEEHEEEIRELNEQSAARAAERRRQLDNRMMAENIMRANQIYDQVMGIAPVGSEISSQEQNSDPPERQPRGIRLRRRRPT